MKSLKRLDGQVYAVKKSSRAHSRASLREVVALAALQDSQHTTRYYNTWIEDGHVYIQMECMDYSLDRVLGKLVRALRHCPRCRQFCGPSGAHSLAPAPLLSLLLLLLLRLLLSLHLPRLPCRRRRPIWCMCCATR
jgi:hypothetical protein